MMLGISLATFTLVHVAISLVGIVSGFFVLFGLIGGKRLDAMTLLFLLTTAATSISGFGFPFDRLLPSHVIGIVSLVVLVIAVLARYGHRLAGASRTVYVICAVLALYFNVFVLVVQSFRKVPALESLAPTQSEPPFLIAQLVVMALFIWWGIQAVRGFRNS